MLKLLDTLVQLDHLKNAKASIPNDFSWYKRYANYFRSIYGCYSDADYTTCHVILDKLIFYKIWIPPFKFLSLSLLYMVQRIVYGFKSLALELVNKLLLLKFYTASILVCKMSYQEKKKKGENWKSRSSMWYECLFTSAVFATSSLSSIWCYFGSG